MQDWLLKISPCVRIVGHSATTAEWVEPMRYIYDHELVLFAGSDYVVELENRVLPCPAGSYLIVPPGRKHITRNIRHRPGHRYWVHFDWVFSGDASGCPVMTYCPAVPHKALFRFAPAWVPAQIQQGAVTSQNRVIEQFNRLEYLFNFADATGRMTARGVCLELLLGLLLGKPPAAVIDKHPESAGKSNVHVLASQIRRQLNRLSDQPACEPVMIREFLERSGLTYAHQCRVFRKYYGISPLQYVTELRMTRAKILLRDTNHPVADIARLLGYDNLSYFCRLFRKSSGYSPSDFRHRHS